MRFLKLCALSDTIKYNRVTTTEHSGVSVTPTRFAGAPYSNQGGRRNVLERAENKDKGRG
eukprot:m.1649265 g.1649265  ORF g.1649265 m.1649265 type:complete len:60 (+) comp82425_c0_seq1:44-223(+)